MSESRRDFVKHSVAASGLLWAAPAVTTVSKALAQSGSPACPDEACPGHGIGVSLTLPVVGTIVLAETTSGPAEVLGTPAPVLASVIRSEVGGPACFSEAFVDELTVTAVPGLVITEGTLTSSVEIGPDCTPTLHSSIVNVEIKGKLYANGEATPNTTIIVNLPLVGRTVVIINEQGSTCRDGIERHYVNALHATFTPALSAIATIELIVAHAEVGTTCCSC